jgi:predicted DNA-binding transcriptional regulator AlpA
MAVYNIQSRIDPAALLRLPQVLSLIPVSRSTWWNGVRTGRFPKPVKLSERTTCWRASDILALIANTIPQGRVEVEGIVTLGSRPKTPRTGSNAPAEGVLESEACQEGPNK